MLCAAKKTKTGIQSVKIKQYFARSLWAVSSDLHTDLMFYLSGQYAPLISPLYMLIYLHPRGVFLSDRSALYWIKYYLEDYWITSHCQVLRV